MSQATINKTEHPHDSRGRKREIVRAITLDWQEGKLICLALDQFNDNRKNPQEVETIKRIANRIDNAFVNMTATRIESDKLGKDGEVIRAISLDWGESMWIKQAITFFEKENKIDDEHKKINNRIVGRLSETFKGV